MGDSNENWNKESDVEVNSMCYNQDESLFVLGTTRGYRIFDSVSLMKVSKEDDYQDIIGNISQAQTLFGSQYVFFVGNEDNDNHYSTYPPNQLMIWDDLKKTKAGLIMMKNNITAFNLTNNVVAIFASNILYLFELRSLKYIMKITNLNLNNKLYSIASDTVAYTTIQRKSIVSVIKFRFDNEHKIKEKRNMKISTSFSEIQSIQVSKCGGIILVSSLLGNKIHIFDLADCSLKCCVFTGNRIISLENIQFSMSLKYVMYISDQIKLEIISIKNKDNNRSCNCNEHDDNLMLGNETRKPSLFEGLMSGFGDKTKSINQNGLVSTLDILNGINSVLYAGFDMKRKNELVY